MEREDKLKLSLALAVMNFLSNIFAVVTVILAFWKNDLKWEVSERMKTGCYCCYPGAIISLKIYLILMFGRCCDPFLIVLILISGIPIITNLIGMIIIL